jgi:signal peptidase II
MADPAQEDGVRLLHHGLAIAAATFVADQATKWWALKLLDLETLRILTITPWLDFSLHYNEGISYSLLKIGPWLLIGLSLAITAWLVNWLRKTTRPMVALSLGLLIGGALGNAMDRLVHPGVVDFVAIHWRGTALCQWLTLNQCGWYIFNLADAAIVAGVALLLYDGVREGRSSA